MSVVPVTVYNNIHYKRIRSLPILIYFHGGQFFDSGNLILVKCVVTFVTCVSQ